MWYQWFRDDEAEVELENFVSTINLMKNLVWLSHKIFTHTLHMVFKSKRERERDGCLFDWSFLNVKSSKEELFGICERNNLQYLLFFSLKEIILKAIWSRILSLHYFNMFSSWKKAPQKSKSVFTREKHYCFEMILFNSWAWIIVCEPFNI